jgi:hypothetical protein
MEIIIAVIFIVFLLFIISPYQLKDNDNSKVNDNEKNDNEVDTFDDFFKYKYTTGVILISFILFTALFAYRSNKYNSIRLFCS